MPAHVITATAVVVAAFALGMIFLKKLPMGMLLIIASVLSSVAAGFGFSLRHIVEGMFTYLNIIIMCATGIIFLKSVEASGAAASLTRSLVVRLYRRRALLMIVIMVLLLIPGALTGIAVNSVLSMGALVAPIMLGMGVPPVATAVIIGTGAVLSMLVPPTNLIAMSIAAGINAPFVGFTIPTLLLSVPLALIVGLVLGLPHMKKVKLEDLMDVLPKVEVKNVILSWVPFILVIGILVLIRAFPAQIPDIGTPLVFIIGTLVAAVTGKRFNVIKLAGEALSGPMLNVLELLLGVGVFVQIASLTGVRGMLVTYSLSLPKLLAYIAAAVSLIIAGGFLSPFGAASIFAVPFALFFLDRNQIITISALSLLCALSQFMPPTAIAGRFAANVAGVKDYGKVWRASLIPTAVLSVICLGVIYWADKIARVIL